MSKNSLQAGDLCGAYRILRLRGQGRTTEVYDAAHIETGHPAVIRRLLPAHAESEAMRQRMLDEAAVLKKAAHLNVAAVYEVGEREGAPFVALERVEGKTLRERLKLLGGPATSAVALCFVKQIADGAAALHAAGAAHGDLRAESVRLTEIDEVKLCDLGPGAPLTSPDRGDVRADIRALGLLFAEMLAGCPVNASSIDKALAGTSPHLRKLIQRAVSGKKTDGFSSMTEVSEALEETWAHLLQETRSSAGLKRALAQLSDAIKSMDKSEGADSEGMDTLLKSVMDATKDLIDEDEG